MLLTRIDVCTNKGPGQLWQIDDVYLSQFNLVTGLNATGKTRLLNAVSNLAAMLTGKIPNLENGTWKMTFKSPANTDFLYLLEMDDNTVVREEIRAGNQLLLDRKNEQGEIFSFQHKKNISFNPPGDRLTLQVRRDVKEYPFLEDLLEWASHLHAYMFAPPNPNQFTAQDRPHSLAGNLDTSSHLLVEALKNKHIADTIKQGFTSIGFPIEDIGFTTQQDGAPRKETYISYVKEKDLPSPTGQHLMSQGMYRAFSLIFILEYLLQTDTRCTVIIDDLGEGLDYEKATALTRLLTGKLKHSKIQLIAATNERFLVNAVDFEDLNVLDRDGHLVRAYNYVNSKERFDEFKITGLTNFDFFMDRMYKDAE
ncbi:MAG: ATP-binding protein [bacterium]|nr:ATP-binding protein [bacterium]